MAIKFTKHYVTQMDESLIQRCIYCGELITDYNNVMVAAGSPPLKGYAEGNVYVSNTQNPKIFLVDESIGNEPFVDCRH